MNRELPPPLSYDAFISYSHAADGLLAPALRNGLQRFGTPWGVFRWVNQVRSVRVFQDQASLSANPALWPTIENALEAAEWFILLASPEASASRWVGREVECWCRKRPVDKLLILQTDGEIAWNEVANDFDWARTTALPKQLANLYRHEPRWIDARWARTRAQATLRDPRFRDLVAELAAPLRGVPKDTLIGEDIAQHRRLNFWRNMGLVLLTTLSIGATAAAVIAAQQRQIAYEQRNEALRNQSKSLASISFDHVQRGSAADAVRIALAALHKDLNSGSRPTVPEAEAVLISALHANRELARFVHQSQVIKAVFSPDGSKVATASSDNLVRIWDPLRSKLIIALHGHESWVTDVAFSADGNLILSSSLDNTARLWRTANGEQLTVIPARYAAFSHDDSKIVTALNDRALVSDVSSGDVIAILIGHRGRINDVRFCSEGKLVVTASDDLTARLWDTATGQQVAAMESQGTAPSSAQCSPDGRTIITASGNHKARLWNSETGDTVAILSGHKEDVLYAEFSRDGTKVLTASADRTARIWDSSTGKQTAILSGHNGWVHSASFSLDGSKVLTSDDGTVRLWNTSSGREIANFREHSDQVNTAIFDRDGAKILTASSDGTSRIWDPAERKADATFAAEGASNVAISSKGNRVVTTIRSTVQVWDLSTLSALWTMPQAEVVYCATFSPDGQKKLLPAKARQPACGTLRAGQVSLSLKGTVRPYRWYPSARTDGR